MNLEELYYAGELIGVVAIVLSLIYVGLQVRQNTASMRDAASSEYADNINDLTVSMATDREFAEIWVKGERQFDALDAVDQQRMLMFELVGISIWRRSFDSFRRGVLPEADWDELRGAIELLSRRESVRRTWKIFHHTYSPAFRQFMSEYIGQPGGASVASDDLAVGGAADR